MPSKAGISGLSVAVAAIGGFLVYAGIRDVPLIDGLREIISGKTPTGKQQKQTAKFTSAVSTGGAEIAQGLASAYSLGAVQPHVKQAANEIGPKFGIKTIYGWAPGLFDHPRGLALDFMIDNITNGVSVGSSLAAYGIANKERLGVTYIIYNMQIASSKQNWAWRPYVTSIRTGDWQHKHHVHMSFEAVHKYVPPQGSGSQSTAV